MSKRIISALMLAVLLLAGCTAEAPEKEEVELVPDRTIVKEEPAEEEAPKPNASFKMDAEMAKKIMDSDESHIVLDVRTPEEFAAGHIENAVNIPVEELLARQDELPADKAMTLLVYCRSGNRSDAAADLLLDLGYSQVIDFGGLNDWPYEVVK